MDKELAQVVADAELGRRYADKLLKVWLLDGSEEWLLVHIEVQGWRDVEFPQRMFVYAYRLYDRYAREIVSLAVLADETTKWRPDSFHIGRWGSRLGLDFPTVKLLDYAERETELAADPNPFAIVVQAHLAAQATRNDPTARYRQKLRLTRLLYERGHERQQIIDLFRFLDWLLRLPEDLALQFTEAINEIEEDLPMPYVTDIERRGEIRGEARGALRLLRGLLQQRFGELPPEVDERLAKADVQRLDVWSLRMLDATALEDVFADESGAGINNRCACTQRSLGAVGLHCLRTHLLADRTRRHVVGLGLQARGRAGDEAGDVGVGSKRYADVDAAIGGDLVPAVKHRAGGEAAAAQVRLAKPSDQQPQPLVVECGDMLGGETGQVFAFTA